MGCRLVSSFEGDYNMNLQHGSHPQQLGQECYSKVTPDPEEQSPQNPNFVFQLTPHFFLANVSASMVFSSSSLFLRQFQFVFLNSIWTVLTKFKVAFG